MIRRWLWSVSAGVGLLLLAACGTVPDGGPPVAVRDQQQGADGVPEVNVVIPGPRVGGEPPETMTGFLAAAGITQNRSRLAEEFLTTSATDEFTKGSGVQIVRIISPPTLADDPADGETTLHMSLQVSGTISESGVYQQAASNLELNVRLVRERDVWLFATPPPSALVRDSDFGKAFRPVTVYFPVAGRDVLVPEQRYVDGSIRTDALATPIVRMLFGGASSWLAPVTRQPLPGGVHLRSNVTVQNGDAIVDFSSEIESASAAEINAFAAQIGWSLRRYHSGQIRLLVNGREISVGGVKATQRRTDWSRYNPAYVDDVDLEVVVAGAVRRYGGNRTINFGGDAGSSQVISAAVSLDGQSAAAVREIDGVAQLWLGETQGSLSPVLSGQQIGRPSWGGAADALLVTVDGALYRVTRSGTGGMARPVRVEGQVGPIRAIRLAYDGVRVVLSAGDQGQAFVGVVSYDRDNQTATVQGLRALPTPGSLVDVQDVAWYGPTTAFVAGREADGMAAIWELAIDGSAQAPTPRNGLRAADVSLAAAATDPVPQPVFIDLGGQLFQRFRESWTFAIDPGGATAPFYPG